MSRAGRLAGATLLAASLAAGAAHAERTSLSDLKKRQDEIRTALEDGVEIGGDPEEERDEAGAGVCRGDPWRDCLRPALVSISPSKSAVLQPQSAYGRAYHAVSFERGTQIYELRMEQVPAEALPESAGQYLPYPRSRLITDAGFPNAWLREWEMYKVRAPGGDPRNITEDNPVQPAMNSAQLTFPCDAFVVTVVLDQDMGRTVDTSDMLDFDLAARAEREWPGLLPDLARFARAAANAFRRYGVCEPGAIPEQAAAIHAQEAAQYGPIPPLEPITVGIGAPSTASATAPADAEAAAALPSPEQRDAAARERFVEGFDRGWRTYGWPEEVIAHAPGVYTWPASRETLEQ